MTTTPREIVAGAMAALAVDSEARAAKLEAINAACRREGRPDSYGSATITEHRALAAEWRRALAAYEQATAAVAL